MKSKPRSQAERRGETRAAILHAAARIFAERGLHAASLDAIAHDAGCTRGAVYYNFADKEELFLELLDQRCTQHLRDLQAVFAGDDDPERQTRVAADEALAAMTGDTEWRALYLEFLALAARDPGIRDRFSSRSAEMLGALEDVVAEQTEPFAQALPVPPQQLAVVLDGLATGLWGHHMLHGAEMVPPDLLSKAVALIVEGLAARAAAEPSAADDAADEGAPLRPS